MYHHFLMYFSSFPHVFIIISSCIYHHQCSEPEVVERGCRAEICSHSRCTCSYDDDADDDDADDDDDDDDDDAELQMIMMMVMLKILRKMVSRV